MNKIEQFKKELEESQLNVLYDDNWKKIIPENTPNLTFGQLIAHHLFKVIDKTSSKYISAVQVGVPYKVSIVNVREELYFINPIILDEAFPISYIESDISYPNKIVETYRFGRILVSALNLKSPIWFGVKANQGNLLNDQVAKMHPVVQEAVAIQHCIDVNNNISMFERNKPYTYKQPKKLNRNEMVTIYKNGNEMKVKYKKINLFLNQGWSKTVDEK